LSASTATPEPANTRYDVPATRRRRGHDRLPEGPDRTKLILAGVVALAAVVRFSTLGLQSYWSDEAVTVGLAHKSLGHMLSALPNSERTPPVYYVVAWFWSRIFGSSEAGLRSLSALAGTATVLLVYAIARRMAGQRAGLIAAALIAVSPILVWYSQEARSYELLVCLCAASVWLWQRAAEQPSTRRLAAWGVVAALAIATHYFASFIVIFEALALLRAQPTNRDLWVVLGAMAMVQLALLPLAIHQAHAHEIGDYITATSLSSRVISVPKRFLLGEHGAPPGTTPLFAVALVGLLAAAIWLFAIRLGAPTRRHALQMLSLAIAAILLPLLLALLGLDFFAYRNLLAVWVLLAVAGSAALAISGSRLARLTTMGLGLAFLALTVAVSLTPSLQRADWRFSPTALGRPPWARVMIITPNFEADPFRIYVPSAAFMHSRRVQVREVDLVGYRIPPRGHVPHLGFGFHLIVRVNHQKLSFLRYIAQRPVSVDVPRLPGLTRDAQAFLLQSP